MWCGVVYGMVWCGMVCDMVWCDMVWCVVWYRTLRVRFEFVCCLLELIKAQSFVSVNS